MPGSKSPSPNPLPHFVGRGRTATCVALKGTKVRMAKIAALIVAAGKGERAGGAVPKQFQLLLGQPVLRRSVAAFAAVPEIDVIQIVAAKERWPETSAAIAGQEILPFAEGGETRQDSVRNGLEALEAQAPDFVL